MKRSAPTPAAAPTATEKRLPAVFAIVGDDEAGKQSELERLLERLGKDATVHGYVDPSGGSPEAEVAALAADLRTRSLFGGRKVVVARDGDSLVKRADKLLVALLGIDTGCHLVMLLRSLDGRLAFSKQLKEMGGLIARERPKADAFDFAPAEAFARSEQLGAIAARAADKGLELEDSAALELAGRVGTDLLLLDAELEKLALFRGSERRKTTRGDVAELTPRSAAWDQFKLFQEVASGDASAALERLRGMLDQGALDRSGKRVSDPASIGLGLVALLHHRLRMLALHRELTAAGAGREQLLEALDIKNPGQLFYLGREAGLPLVARAERALPLLLDADRALKRSEPAVVVLEGLVLRLARLAR